MKEISVMEHRVSAKKPRTRAGRWNGSGLVAILVGLTAATPSSAQHTGQPIEVPLEVVGGRLVVPVVAPDGTELSFTVSTANPITILTTAGEARIGGQSALDMGGVSVSLGGARTIPDASLTADGRTLDGMIGANTLNQFDALVDVPGGRLLLQPPSGSVKWDGYALSDPVRMLVYHGVALGIQVELNDTPYSGTLDLGTPIIAVNQPVADAIDLSGEVGTLALGATAQDGLTVRAIENDLFGRWDPNGNGFVIVGAPVAYDCAIAISWVHQELRTCVR